MVSSPRKRKERDGHGGHRTDHEAVARQQGQGAADGAGPEIADLAVAAHAQRLQDFAGGGGRHG